MTQIERDGIVEALSRLPLIEPDTRRAERARARCQHALARHRRAGARRPDMALWSGELLLPGAVSLVFLVEVVRRAVLLYGL